VPETPLPDAVELKNLQPDTPGPPDSRRGLSLHGPCWPPACRGLRGSRL